MSVKHTFVSPKADGADATLVRPSDWNAEHAVALTDADISATIITTHIADAAAHHAKYTNAEAVIAAKADADIADAITKKHAQNDVGGLYGINVETLTGNKTLTPGTDEIYQYLNENGSHRQITLDTGSASIGDRFVIRHNGNYNAWRNLNVLQGATTVDYILAGRIAEFIFDGSNWVAAANGTGEDNTRSQNVAIGYNARGYTYGTAVGYGAYGYTSGAALGNGADGYNYGAGVGAISNGGDYGVAIGYGAIGNYYGVALGYQTKTNYKKYSVALGYYSETERYGETSTNIDANSTQKNNVVQGRWSKTTTDATPVEIFCAGQADRRFTIRASSALAFKMTIVARDNVANEVAMYVVEDGLIKRDAAGNTTLVNCTVTTVYEDDAGWDVAVTADDTNEALIITVTGDSANPVQWAVRMDGVETHF